MRIVPFNFSSDAQRRRTLDKRAGRQLDWNSGRAIVCSIVLLLFLILWSLIIYPHDMSNAGAAKARYLIMPCSSSQHTLSKGKFLTSYLQGQFLLHDLTSRYLALSKTKSRAFDYTWGFSNFIIIFPLWDTQSLFWVGLLPHFVFNRPKRVIWCAWIEKLPWNTYRNLFCLEALPIYLLLSWRRAK